MNFFCIGLYTALVCQVSVSRLQAQPAVLLLTPANNVHFTAPATVQFTVSVGPTVKKVEYFRGVTRIGAVTNSPFSLTISNFAVGNWTVNAVATDALGASAPTVPTQIFVERAKTAAPFTMQILHASDFEASIDGMKDVEGFSQVLAGLRALYPTNTVFLSSGNNYITGPFFNASGDPGAPYDGVQGRGDITILNALGLQASALGNQEFDLNTPLVRSLILPDSDVNYPGTQFPYLSADLDFSSDANLAGLVAAEGLDAKSLTNRIARSTTLKVGGQTIGVVGATSTELRFISSPGDVRVNTNLVGAVQAAVDNLLAQGINKVIVLSCSQDYHTEFALAKQLHDVDAVIAGGSQAIFAKPTDRLRTNDIIAESYPATFTDRAGEPVHVVNTDANYHYVGRLVLQFDANGVVSWVDPVSGPYATDAQGVAATGNFPINPIVEGVLTNLAAIIDSKDGVIFGRTTQYLSALREDVRTRESNLGDVTADANLWRARQTDTNTVVSIKNGGGIRNSIGTITTVGGRVVHLPPQANVRVGKKAGDISQLDIEDSLRFNNNLALITVTAQQLRDAFEWGVSASAPGATPGQFPQSAGVSFSFNPANPPMVYRLNTNNQPSGILEAGSRLRSLVVTNADGSLDLVVEQGRVVGNPNRAFRVVTIEFMANGGDNYYPLSLGIDRLGLVPASVTNIVFTTDGAEQKALADYLKQAGTITLADPTSETAKRQLDLSARADTVLSPVFTKVLPQGAGASVAFQTLPGRKYRLENRAALGQAWSDTGLATTGDGRIKTLVDPTARGASVFYRLVTP